MYVLWWRAINWFPCSCCREPHCTHKLHLPETVLVLRKQQSNSCEAGWQQGKAKVAWRLNIEQGLSGIIRQRNYNSLGSGRESDTEAVKWLRSSVSWEFRAEQTALHRFEIWVIWKGADSGVKTECREFFSEGWGSCRQLMLVFLLLCLCHGGTGALQGALLREIPQSCFCD